MPFSYSAYIDPQVILWAGAVVCAYSGIVMLANAVNMVRLVWPSLAPERRMNVIKALILTFIDEFLVHRNLRKCREEIVRWAFHLLVVWGMIIMFVTTAIDGMLVHDAIWRCHLWHAHKFGFVYLPDAEFYETMCYHIRHSLDHPVKIMYNVGGLMFVTGSIALLVRRKVNRTAYECAIPYDWYLLILFVLIGVTGFLAQGLRVGAEALEHVASSTAWGLFGAGLVFYCVHLASVIALFTTIPYTKVAHIVYRYVALTLVNYKGVPVRKVVIA